MAIYNESCKDNGLCPYRYYQNSVAVCDNHDIKCIYAKPYTQHERMLMHMSKDEFAAYVTKKDSFHSEQNRA